MFATSRATFIRRFVVTLGLMILLAPFLVWWSLLCVHGMFNTPHQWIPPTNEQRREFEWFVANFESQALVVISWPDCTVDDPRLAELEAALSDPDDANYNPRNAELFDRVVTGYSVLRQLTLEPLSLPRTQALARLRGVLVGTGSESSCAVVVFTDRGGYERRDAIEIILETAEAVCELERDAFRLAGPPVDGVAIDNSGVNTMIRYALPSAFLSLLLCWWCLRTWRYAITILSAAAFGEGLCLALVFLSGFPMNAILILMPPFVFVLTIASGVHLVNYYFAEAGQHGIQEAPRRAMRVGLFPCVLATVTTAIGLGSLLISNVHPIRTFGGFAAVGVATTLLLLFLLLPGVMTLWPLGVGSRSDRQPRLDWLWIKWANFVIARATPIFLASVGLIAALGWGLYSVQTSVKLRDLFSDGDRILREYAWLEEELGPMVPVEIIVTFRSDSRVSASRRLQLVKAIASTVNERQQVGGVMSAETFALPRRRGTRVRQLVQQSVSRSRFKRARFLHEDGTGQSWRISARVPALSDLDYEAFLRELKGHVTRVVDSSSKAVDEPIDITVTGAVPLIYQTQHTLLTDLISSILVAFSIVGIVMIIVLRSIRAGLLVMIPNVFPTAAIFGTMGWLNIPIDIGSVMTASTALGIAVVDTLHFLTWFQREVSAGQSPPDAVRRAYSHCATAILQTSVICGVGMLIFMFSSFMPVCRFAWMMFILLMAALFGDLVILPAILSGPLGRVFVSRKSS